MITRVPQLTIPSTQTQSLPNTAPQNPHSVLTVKYNSPNICQVKLNRVMGSMAKSNLSPIQSADLIALPVQTLLPRFILPPSNVIPRDSWVGSKGQSVVMSRLEAINTACPRFGRAIARVVRIILGQRFATGG